MNEKRILCGTGSSGRHRRNWLPTAILLACGGLFQALPIAAQTANNSNPKSTGQPPREVLSGAAQLVSHSDPTQMMRLVFALQPPHLAEEKQFVQDVQTKGNPLFHHFLTQAQWIERFAPTVEDEQALVDWAQSQGFTITNRYPNRMIVNVEAPVSTIEKALQVKINDYTTGQEPFYSNDRVPSIPASLSAIVQEVLGMNSLAIFQPMSVGLRASPPAYMAGPLVTRGLSYQRSASAPKPHAKPAITNGFYDPTDIYASYAYDYDALQNLGHCCNPTGNPNGPTAATSIGVATAYDFNVNDLNGFIAQYPYLAFNVDPIYIGGQVGCPGNNPTCNKETTLDIEWATATSNSFGDYHNSAAIWAYQGSNSLVATFLSIYQQMLSDGHVNIVSSSWGCSETCTGSYMNSVDNAFSQMAGEGWTIFVAAGDQGATEGCTAQDAVDYPASDPNVIAVGGTTLQTGPGGFGSEVGWTGGTTAGSCAGNNGGGGGGISSYWSVPSYQTALGFTQRELPDVALNASNGQNIFYNGALQGIGGTSIATPEMAGFMAQENSYLLSLGNVCADGNYACAPAGNITNTIYNAGANPSSTNHYPFYDILSGCNSNDITLQFGLPYYCAATGWDNVTGWGSPNMLQLAWLINASFAGGNGLPVVSISGPVLNKWYNTDETVNWTITEASLNGYPTVGIAGYSAQWDSDPGDVFSEATPSIGGENSFYTGPQVPNATSGTIDFTGSGVSVGCHTANVRAFDNAGLESYDVTYGPVCYDNVPPSTSVTFSSDLTPVTVSLYAIDVGSGVAKTLYRLDSGAWTTYKAPFTVSALGTNTISYYSVDVAGNVESTQTTTFPVLGGTTATLASWPNPSAYSTAVTFTATVTSPSGTPAGTVKFYNASTVIGSGTLSGGVATLTTATLAAGAHSIFAIYEGTAKFAANNSNTVTQMVNAATTTTTLVSSPNPSNAGQLVTFTATVTSAGGIPSGTVSFYSGSTLVGSGTLVGGVATFATSSIAAGNYRITAAYTGSADFNSSSSSPLTQIVDSTSLADTSTSLASSEPYNSFGHAITLTATVTSASGTPMGRVTFYNGRTTLGSGNLSGGVATLSSSALPAGTEIITATYGGSATFNSSTSAPFTQLTLGVYDVGNSPEYIISDGTNMWVSNSLSNTVSKLRTSDGTVLTTIGVGVDPQGLAFDGTNIWVANGSNTVTLLNASTGNGVVNYSAGPYPGALAFDGTHIWVASHEYNVLTELQASNGAVVNTFTFGPANLSLGAILFDGTYIWLTYGSSIAKLQASTGALLGTFSDGTVPGAMAFDGTHIWVANYGAGSVSKLLASTGAVEATYPVSSPSGLVFDGTNIWVSNYMNATVTQLRASDGTSQGSYMVGAGPVGLAFDGANVWVAVAVTDTVCKF